MDILKKVQSHLLLGEKMREKQKEFFKLSKTEYTRRKEVMAQAKVLEAKFDESAKELLDLIKTSGQPELFR